MLDVSGFKTLLEETPAIKTVYLTSAGGQVESAQGIADILIDYELNTHGVEICFSACTTIFLGGEKRTMERAAKIGFHRSSWGESMKAYYEYNQEYYGWRDVWGFAAWVHDDSLNEVYTDLQFLLGRNVAPLFAIKTLRAKSDDGRFPRRKELLGAEFLTE